ncbi:hypothetical protein EVG20_g7099 [Dentipellis fragilis]|uniref:AA9 family lytic polysaccharide monooxygenase n=1 Tax=Dentipellis fragilis TaxID=205917 RepID=A0A4Y9YGT7_9AGAM|nr:hypothetical protein EVG20_g7099 [Dentipellis fragilis]
MPQRSHSSRVPKDPSKHPSAEKFPPSWRPLTLPLSNALISQPLRTAIHESSRERLTTVDTTVDNHAGRSAYSSATCRMILDALDAPTREYPASLRRNARSPCSAPTRSTHPFADWLAHAQVHPPLPLWLPSFRRRDITRHAHLPEPALFIYKARPAGLELQELTSPLTSAPSRLKAMFAAAALLALASTAIQGALAHGGVLAYANAGTWYQGWAPYNSPTGQTTIQRPWSTYNPITSVSDPQLACNDDGTSGALQLTGTVQAGSAITAYWNQVWPHAYGPMLTYLAQCPGTTCTGVNSNTLKWFKIDQSGLINGTVYDGFWGDGLMIADNSSWTTTIPATVPSGNYLIRFETIALHSLPAQFYPECAQINIVGGGSLAPTAAELVTFPGGYGANDPGLVVDIYSNQAQTMTAYPIPGPPLYGHLASLHELRMALLRTWSSVIWKWPTAAPVSVWWW